MLILGDLTDAKDRHSAKLVNRLAAHIERAADVMNVYILKGNHDYLNEDWPFFHFLSRLDGVKFIINPLSFPYEGDMAHWVFIPHTRATGLQGLLLVRDTTRYCFMHHTVKGAVASNGMRMEDDSPGIRWPHVDTCKYYSGDIHVPQRVGPLEYVGSPYPVHFGDAFKARFLMLPEADGHPNEYDWKGIARQSIVITDPKQMATHDLRTGDQVKVRIQIPGDRLSEWQEMKRDVQACCEQQGVRLMSVEVVRPPVRRQLVEEHLNLKRDAMPLDVLRRYAQRQHVDPLILEAGESLL